jgi:serine/threonine protein kinase
MVPDHQDLSEREQRLGEIVFACLQVLESGQPLNQQEVLAQHPEFAADLEEFFAGRKEVHQLATPLREVVKMAAGENSTAAGSDSQDLRATPEARSFGDYDLLELIGQGGMGVVYKAFQKSLHRQVALKMIRAGGLAGDLDPQRLRNEAEAAAHLDHPHIVPIYEVGDCDGRPYFSMKLIEGGNLGQWIADCGRPIADFQKDAAQLLAQVARAVHHAHQRGILHRDLKPSNILLEYPERGLQAQEKSANCDLKSAIPYVTDFGLAKWLRTDTSLTQSGLIVGTPGYLAPEQATGPKKAITTAADVYGLGAILYALLTGQPPFRADTPLETLAQVKENEPELPSGLHRLVNRDLETICLKCLQKDPAQRYASAEALAEDLERWLAGKPIQARPLSRLARIGRWSRRNPAIAGLTACVLVLIILALVGLAIGSWMIWREQSRTLSALGDVETQRQRAEVHFRQALETVERMSQVANARLGTPGNAQFEQKAVAEEALKLYLRLLDEKSDDPDVRLKTARAYLFAADLRKNLGDGAAAEDFCRRAIQLLVGLVEEFTLEPSYRSCLASARYQLAILISPTFNRHHEAEGLLLQAIALRERLVTECPEAAEHPRDLAETYHKLGYLCWTDARMSEAEKDYRHALSLYQGLSTKFPHPAISRDQATVYNSLGVLLQTMWRLEEAESAHHKALVLLETGDGSDSERWRTLGQLATLWTQTGRQQEAEQAWRKLLENAEKTVASFPHGPDSRLEVSLLSRRLGWLLEASGRPREAESLYRKAQALQEKLAAEFPQTAALSLQLGLTCFALSDLRALSDAGEAQEACARARRAFRRAIELDPKNPDARIVYGHFLANCVSTRFRDPVEALEMGRQALALTPGDPNIWNTLGLAQYRSGRARDALASLLKSVELRHGGTGLDHFFLALTYAQLNDKKQANLWYQRGLAWLDRTRRGREAELRRTRQEAAAALEIVKVGLTEPDRKVPGRRVISAVQKVKSGVDLPGRGG